jgi:hypothetical protein
LIQSQCEKGKEPILNPTELDLQLQVDALMVGYCILGVPHAIPQQWQSQWQFLGQLKTTTTLAKSVANPRVANMYYIIFIIIFIQIQ